MIGWKRAFRELPEPESDQNRTGIAFVAVLFSLVVGKIAEGLIPPLQSLFGVGQSYPRPGVSIAHYVVALVLVVTSFVGYFTSRNGPQLRIKFFNLPFLSIVLDSTMVVAYFVLASYSEGDTKSAPDARPEAIIVAFSFLLYLAWDVIGWTLAKDKLSQLARGRSPIDAFGPRRWVTLAMTLVAIGLAIATLTIDRFRESTSFVVGMDVSLVVLCLVYRVLKSWFDPDVEIPSGPASAKVHIDDWRRIVPAAIRADEATLAALRDAAGPMKVGAESDGRAEALRRLHAAGAVIISSDLSGTEFASLSDTGKAYAAALDA